jgi:signal transduction histidine kinase
MFKSSFAKYLTAFVIIILVSFLMLSGIITSMIRTHVTSDKEEKLQNSCQIIASSFESDGVKDVDAYIQTHARSIQTLAQLVKSDYDFHVLVTDASGNVLLSTYKTTEQNMPSCNKEDGLGTVTTSVFAEEVSESGISFLTYRGELKGVTDSKERCIAFGKSIFTDGEKRGYVFTLASTAKEDVLIRVARKTVINSSIWVMLAAVIAAYFITERIVHPLKNMTRAVKSFGKGDFSERITVNGHDEVSELASAFNNMAESLENLESMRNSFLANVSHDLRTPMTTISGFIDGIISGAIPEEQHEHYLGVISTEVHRLSRLVNQLLDISRLESGDRKFNFTDFDVAEVSRLILLSFEQKIDEKHLDVEFFAEEDTMSVNADKDAIYQIIYNLCHNAIKFSTDGGKLAINISRISGKKIKFSIYDQGQVIPNDDAKHIFDRFYKTDKSRGLDKSGVGLGLYICKTIIDAHGETIKHEPHDDGCEFWFTLKEGESLNKHKF